MIDVQVTLSPSWIIRHWPVQSAVQPLSGLVVGWTLVLPATWTRLRGLPWPWSPCLHLSMAWRHWPMGCAVPSMSASRPMSRSAN